MDDALDKSYAFGEGWRLGESGKELTEDHLIPWPQRLKLAFTVGYEGGREQFLDRTNPKADEDLPPDWDN